MASSLRTVSAFQSLLKEDDYDLKEAGLKSLLSNVNLHWSDIANNIGDIESLFRDPKFKNQQLAAILLSKLYFHLNDYKEALNYALKSGAYFNVDDHSDFTEVLVNKSIERYIEHAKKSLPLESGERYKEIVDGMVEKSLRKREYRMPLGIALESYDLVLAKRIIAEINYHELVEAVLPHLDYMEPEFKHKVLVEISQKKMSEGKRKAYSATTPIQYINLVIMFKYNDDFATVSALIYELVKRKELEIAYTLALEVSEMHGFNSKVAKAIPIEVGFEKERRDLIFILDGRFKEDLHRAYLQNFAKTDPHYQNALKAIELKNSVAHGSAQLAIALLQAYTQDDSFLKVPANLEWAAKSTHWAKFAAIASLGLIHRNVRSMDPLKPFLPEANKNVVNHFPNGGAMYGLGLIFAGTNNPQVLGYLTSMTAHAEHSKNDVIMHGAALGLGLTAFASSNSGAGNRLKELMSVNNSVIGEAAALGIGLVYAGTGNEMILSELANSADESDHEKILRSICLSIGIVNFELPSKEYLKNIENNPKLKLAVPMYLAMAYFKTSNHEAIRKLLQCANDISNEVKRAAVIALGFVMYHDPHLVQLIQMMIYSYNPSIRYACAMALMVGARDSKEVIELIWPLLTDAVDYVRQAAFISIAVLLQVSTVQSEPKLADFRKLITDTMGKKHEETLAKMGAILATGILDIGGRNMVVSLTTRSGVAKIEAVVSMLVFSNFWNWFPYINFIGLTLTPSAYIGVTTDLKVPANFQLRSTAKPGTFDYPANIVKEQKKEEVKKDTKVTLSTTIKVNARAKQKKAGKGGADDLDSELSLSHQVSLLNQQSLAPPQLHASASSVMPNLPALSQHLSLPVVDESLPKEHEKEKQQVQFGSIQKKEELYTVLKNPHRVAEKQRKYIQFVAEARYHPILPERKIGICFLKDSQPGVPDEYLFHANSEEPKPAPAEPGASSNGIPAPLEQVPEVPESFVMDEEDEQSLKHNKEQ